MTSDKFACHIIVFAGSKEKVSGEKREGRAVYSENRLPQIQHSETGNVYILEKTAI